MELSDPIAIYLKTRHEKEIRYEWPKLVLDQVQSGVCLGLILGLIDNWSNHIPYGRKLQPHLFTLSARILFDRFLRQFERTRQTGLKSWPKYHLIKFIIIFRFDHGFTPGHTQLVHLTAMREI